MDSWSNRIVRHSLEDPSTLVPNPQNWREHPTNQRQAMAETLDSIGWVQSVIVNERTGHIVDGHLRVEEAIRNNEIEVPVVWVDLSDDEERTILATFDPLSAIAEANKEKLDALLHEVKLAEPSMRAMLSDLAKREGLYSYQNTMANEDETCREDIIPEQFVVMIECATEQEQLALLERLMQEGLKCRALTS